MKNAFRFLVICIAGVFPVLAESQGDFPPTIDPAVSCVVTGGSWQANDLRGHFRVVVENRGWEHVKSAVWLEWIEERNVGNRIQSRVPVSEINNHVGLSVGCPTLAFPGEGIEFRFDAVYAHDPGRRAQIRLIPGAVGRYACEGVAK